MKQFLVLTGIDISAEGSLSTLYRMAESEIGRFSQYIGLSEKQGKISNSIMS